MRALHHLSAALCFLAVFAERPSCAAEEGAAPDDTAVERATELRVQATTLAKSGDFITADELFSRSIEVARTVGDAKSRDWTLLFIATAQARAGSVYAGIETANTIETEAYQIWALSDIAPIQAAAGDLSGALEMATKLPHESARARALGSIAIGQARKGDVSQAGLIANGITEPAMKARAYAEITRAMAPDGR